jgi:hypothetical protein
VRPGRTRNPIGVVTGVLFVSLVACSGPKPILYPNEHFKTVGQEGVEQDISACREMAEAAGADQGKGKGGQVAGSTAVGGGIGAAGGAVGGAVVGRPGTGAAIGAAAGATGGLLRGLFGSRGPSRAHMNFVDRCLKEKGYEPVGWK